MLALGVVAVVLGIVFEKQNIAFMVGLAFAVAASSNFPVLLLSMYWRGLTTRGACVGGWLGLITAVALTVLSKAIWVAVLGHAAPLFTDDAPALFSMPVAFIGCWLFSITDYSTRASEEADAFDGQYVRSQTGIGATTASAH